MAKGPWKKALTLKKGASAKINPQSFPNLDTEEGKAEIKPAGEWLLAMERKFEGNDILAKFQNEQGSSLITFSFLLGHPEALSSAREALASLAGRQDGVRKLFRVAQGACEMSAPLRRALVLELAEYDGSSHLPHLPEVLREEEAKGTRNRFVLSLTKRELNAARKPLPKPFCGAEGGAMMLPWPWADVSPLRFALVAGWVGGGFWMAEDTDIVASLRTSLPLQTLRRKPPKVTEPVIREARKALGLVSYKGPGRLKWTPKGWISDVALRAQVRLDDPDVQRVLRKLQERRNLTPQMPEFQYETDG